MPKSYYITMNLVLFSTDEAFPAKIWIHAGFVNALLHGKKRRRKKRSLLMSTSTAVLQPKCSHSPSCKLPRKTVSQPKCDSLWYTTESLTNQTDRQHQFGAAMFKATIWGPPAVAGARNLEHRESSDIETSVWTSTEIPSGVQFGPFEGDLKIGTIKDNRESPFMLEVRYKDGRMTSVSGPDDGSMRWMRFISPARDQHEQNVEAVRKDDGRVFFRTIRGVLKGEELLVWYGAVFVESMGIPSLTKDNIQGDHRYVCNYCWKVFRYPNTLKAHIRFKCTKNNAINSSSNATHHSNEASSLVTTATHSRQSDNVMGTSGGSHAHNRDDAIVYRRHSNPKITPHFNSSLLSPTVRSAFRPHAQSASSLPKDHHLRQDSDRAIIRKIEHHPVTLTTPVVTSCPSISSHHIGTSLHANGDMKKLFTTPAFPVDKSVSYTNVGQLLPYHIQERSLSHGHTPHKPYEKSCCPLYSQSTHVHGNLSFSGGLERSLEHAHYTDYHPSYPFYHQQTYEMHSQSLRTYNSVLPVHTGEYLTSNSHYLPYKVPYPTTLKYPEPFNFVTPSEEYSRFKMSSIDSEIAMHTQPVLLNDHQRALQQSSLSTNKKKGHLCIYCGKLYSRKYGLKIHLRTHTGYKPLKCKVCLRPFGDPSNLNKHIRLHAEGETPYRCEYCGKVLVRRRDLDRHIKSRHPNEAKKKEAEDAKTSDREEDEEEEGEEEEEEDEEIDVSGDSNDSSSGSTSDEQLE
ncbi:LOW QUALITY PROTEIN: PR domain zinc finger protein 13-like [Glandiceps talaboti]